VGIVDDQLRMQFWLSSTSFGSFRDLALVGDNMLVLTERGVLIVQNDGHLRYNLVRLEEGEWARSIIASQQCMVVEFRRGRQTVLQEFYFDAPESSLSDGRLLHDLATRHVRPGKKHREFHRIHATLIVGKYALVVEPFQVSIFELMINAENPLTLSDNRLTFKFDSIVGLEADQEDQGLVLLVAGTHSLSLVSLSGRVVGGDLFRGGLLCRDGKPGKTELEVEYVGVCGSEGRWECSKTEKYSIEVEPEENSVSYVWVAAAALLGLAILLLGTLYCLARKRLLREISDLRGQLPERRQLSSMNSVENTEDMFG
jgi:hypothetical protein